MSCYHPLKGFPVGINPDTGKTKYKITSYDTEFIMRRFDGRIDVPKSTSKYDSQQWSKFFDFIEIPCGHCIGCRLKYSRDWANRMLLEAKNHKSNYFLTLTYNEEHLPPANPICDLETGETTGELSPIHPLVKKDIQNFMKRLRKKFNNQRIRFYACGEYGSQNMRPHYHIILFGLELPDGDLTPFGSNKRGEQYYISDSIDKLWTDSKTGESLGYHKIGAVTFESCAYVARYVTKKLNGKLGDTYKTLNFPPEWSLMSRKPGIARDYYDTHRDEIYATDELIYSRGLDGKSVSRPPRYYDKLFDIDYPEKSAILKEKRREVAESLAQAKSSLTSLSYQQMLESEEINKLVQIKSLKRK